MLHRLINLLTCGSLNPPDGSASDASAPPSAADVPPPIRVNARFLSPQEQRIFHTLVRLYAPGGPLGEGHVLTQVALNRLLWMPSARRGTRDASRRTSWQNRLRGRSVDFAILDPRTLLPRLAIELDDKSHLTDEREPRDRTVNTACAAAGLRLVRVPGNVTVEELRGMLGEPLR